MLSRIARRISNGRRFQGISLSKKLVLKKSVPPPLAFVFFLAERTRYEPALFIIPVSTNQGLLLPELLFARSGEIVLSA